MFDFLFSSCSLRKDSRVSDAKHPIKLIQLFAFILKIKYSEGFRERGALRVCNGPVDGVPVRGMLRNQVFYFGAKPPAS